MPVEIITTFHSLTVGISVGVFLHPYVNVLELDWSRSFPTCGICSKPCDLFSLLALSLLLFSSCSYLQPSNKHGRVPYEMETPSHPLSHSYCYYKWSFRDFLCLGYFFQAYWKSACKRNPKKGWGGADETKLIFARFLSTCFLYLILCQQKGMAKNF